MICRGARVHDYEVWGRLGEGGMSEVWLAKHTVLCVPVVLKTLRKAVAESVGEAGAKRMFDEARLMARVTSPRVVRAIDAGTLDGRALPRPGVRRRRSTWRSSTASGGRRSAWGCRSGSCAT